MKAKTGNVTDNAQIPLDGSWNITINGMKQEETHLSQLFFSVANIGDHIELTTTLPDSSIPHPTLQLKIYHSIVTAYIDQIKLYQYGTDLYNKQLMVGSGYHWIALPEDYAGRELKICFDVTEDNAFSSIESILLMEEKYVARNFILKNICRDITGELQERRLCGANGRR